MMPLAVIRASNAFKGLVWFRIGNRFALTAFHIGLFGRVADRRTSVQVDVDDDMAAVVGDHGCIAFSA